jgi:hypothetical protein
MASGSMLGQQCSLHPPLEGDGVGHKLCLTVLDCDPGPVMNDLAL